MHAVRCGLIILGISLAALQAHGGEASGSFQVGTSTISPRSASAYEARDLRNARTKVVEVMLSNMPLPAAEIAAALDPHTAAINSEAARTGDYILLWVRPGGSVTMNATFSGSMTQYVATTDKNLTAELEENSESRVAGRLFTIKPLRTLSGESYEIDVTFEAEISRPARGTKLPSDGGDPGKALKALYAAVSRKDSAAMQGAVSSRLAELIADDDWRSPEENLSNAVETLELWLPKKPKVSGGELLDGTAILEVEGEMFQGTRALYLVRMVNEGEGWVYDQSATAGFLP